MTRSKHIKTTNETIREIFLAHGFKVPPELTDMRPYVYEAARALLRHYGVWTIDDPSKTMDSIGYENTSVIRSTGYITVAKGPTKYIRSEE